MNNQERITQIQQILNEKFSPINLKVTDDSSKHAGHPGAASGAGHFSVSITASIFADKTPVQRHQLIYAALADMLETEIHALSIKAKAD